MYWPNHRRINWDEVKTIDQVKDILKSLTIRYEPYKAVPSSIPLIAVKKEDDIMDDFTYHPPEVK